MTRDEITATEAKHLEICRRVIREFDPQLRNRGLKCERPEIETCCDDLANYSSELRAMVTRGSDIVDVLEFFVIEDGKPALSETEAEEFIRTVLLEASTRADPPRT